MSDSPLTLAPAVRDALALGRPVVALETTVLSHGLPWPDSIETAGAMRTAVEAEGAVAAFVGIDRGRATVGLGEAAVERFARGEGVAKASRRDLGLLAAAGADGATTVAGTMALARLAGVEVFATGGIGGVHRGAQLSLDVSADLHELARTPVAVVCSGAKSILDLPRTVELLETLGVPVVGCATDSLPAFHVRSSGLPLDHRIDDAHAAARVFTAHRALGGGAMVFANPVPEGAAIPGDVLEAWVAQALSEARDEAVTGKDVTPFVLRRVAELSDGRTLAANRALLVDNARIGATIAAALVALAGRG